MIRNFYLIFFMCALSLTSLASACPQAPIDEPAFCGKFIEAGRCYCRAQGLGELFCNSISMNQLYGLMMARYHSLQRACTQGQQEVSPQTCIDAWMCYFKGGRDSLNRACSSTGNACQ